MDEPTLREALPEPSHVREAETRLKEAGVKYVLSTWVDLVGQPKTKPVPVSEFRALCEGKGPQFAVHSVSRVPELGPADPDQIPIPDLGSLVICPWDHSVAWVFADLFHQDQPYRVCPRLALKRQVRVAESAGYRFFAGFEPEFIVMRYTDDGHIVKAFDDDSARDNGSRLLRQGYGYDAEFSLDALPFLGKLSDYMAELGWEPKNVVCEGAYSQFELDFGYTDVLGAADRLTFLRVMLKEVAKKLGFFVTFMPKPTQGDWRSGAHINHSMQAADRPGINLFETSDGGWSELSLHAVGGLLKHGAALTAVACSNVNSYKGLIGRAREFEGGTITWAPTHICYGTNNRSAMLRLPQTRRAIENRASDMSVNPYLALAMTVAASLEGVTEHLEAGAPINRTLYDAGDDVLAAMGARRLPTNLLQAIEAFDCNELAKSVFGPTMHKSYSRYKHDEWDRFHEHVTEWETAEYLRFF